MTHLYPTVAELLEIHASEVGYRDQSADLAGLEAIIANAQQTWDGQDLYSGLSGKAAAITFGLAKTRQCFIDGNKRTALKTLPIFVGMNGARLELDDTNAFTIICAVATGEMDQSELSAELEPRIQLLADEDLRTDPEDG